MFVCECTPVHLGSQFSHAINPHVTSDQPTGAIPAPLPPASSKEHRQFYNSNHNTVTSQSSVQA